MTLIKKYCLFNSVAGLIVGVLVWITAGGEGYYFITMLAPVSACLTGWLFWKILMKGPKKLRVSRAVVAGILTGSVSHYFCWILLIIGRNLIEILSGKFPNPFFTIITGALGLTFFSLLFYGWLTVPASILIGVILVKKEKKKIKA